MNLSWKNIDLKKENFKNVQIPKKIENYIKIFQNNFKKWNNTVNQNVFSVL